MFAAVAIKLALLIPGENDHSALAETLTQALLQPLQTNWPHLAEYFHLGAVYYHRGDQQSVILATGDHMLATAEAKGANAWHAATQDPTPNVRSAQAWYSLLNCVLAQQNLSLAFYPIVTLQGQVWHQEGFTRYQLPLVSA